MTDNSYHSPIEQAIRKAMQDGLFDNLPGNGKPLDLQSKDDPNTPDDMRLTYKIMQDNNILPDWITLREVLEDQQIKIRREMQRGWRAYTGTLQDADRAGNTRKREDATRAWKKLRRMFGEAIEQYNKHVLTYNLKVPHGIRQRHFMSLERELARLERD